MAGKSIIFLGTDWVGYQHLCDLLVDLGKRVYEALDGEDAFGRILKGDIGVAIVDLQSVQMGSYEILFKLASLPKPPKLILLSDETDSLAGLKPFQIHSIIYKPPPVSSTCAQILQLLNQPR